MPRTCRESGCGKTTLGKTILRLLKPTSGHIFFDTPPDVLIEIEKLLEKQSSKENKDKLREYLSQFDTTTFKGERLRSLRRRMQIVYQDPRTSLNPRMFVKDIVGEPLIVHKLVKKVKLKRKFWKCLKWSASQRCI